MQLPGHHTPIVAAPMAGGPSTPELVAETTKAGGFGYLPAGYLTVESLREQIAATRARTDEAFGVNLFVPELPADAPTDAQRRALSAYRDELAADAEALGVGVPEGHWPDTDQWAEKLDLLLADPVPVVSFTFGLPSAEEVAALHAAGSALVGTVTTVADARAAAALGLDALCVQGPDAGGHRSTHRITDVPETMPLLDLLAAVREATALPLIAAGGISTTAQVAEVLAAGAYAAQIGTALLRSDEAGTNPAHREALTWDRPTALTRCYSGRFARGLRNEFIDAHDASAPAVYPQVNQVTGPLRKAAAAAGDAERLHMWAGTGHRLAEARPAAEIVAGLAP